MERFNVRWVAAAMLGTKKKGLDGREAFFTALKNGDGVYVITAISPNARPRRRGSESSSTHRWVFSYPAGEALPRHAGVVTRAKPPEEVRRKAQLPTPAKTNTRKKRNEGRLALDGSDYGLCKQTPGIFFIACGRPNPGGGMGRRAQSTKATGGQNQKCKTPSPYMGDPHHGRLLVLFPRRGADPQSGDERGV